MEKISAAGFAEFLMERARRKDGYIMGATGQDPKKWPKGAWWFSQYTGAQRIKALYWREKAERVWDCQGLAEGYINDVRGTGINVYARTNYAGWCEPKGVGKIPSEYRKPGAAVFYHNGARVTHVGYLVRPVNERKPAGDWYVVEARGVMYGVVITRLNSRSWNRWGLMTKYFYYEDAPTDGFEFGERVLLNGCSGGDVRELQSILIDLGYSCGVWGADGEFGDETEAALRAFQVRNCLCDDGCMDQDDFDALREALKDESPDDADGGDGGGTNEDERQGGADGGGTDEDESRYDGTGVDGGAIAGGNPQSGGGNGGTGGAGDNDPQNDGSIAGDNPQTGGANGVNDPQTAAANDPQLDLSRESGRLIVDISRWNGRIKNIGKLKDAVAFVIHRASCGLEKDAVFEYNASLMREKSLPFGVYHYLKALTEQEAKAEARLFYYTAVPFSPKFWALDCEYGKITAGARKYGAGFACEIVRAFLRELKRLGAAPGRTGVYIGHHLYRLWALDYGDYAFLWIPRYGENKGVILEKYFPVYKCDLHQYTSRGKCPGIADKTVDLNRITGKGKDEKWFTGEGDK